MINLTEVVDCFWNRQGKFTFRIINSKSMSSLSGWVISYRFRFEEIQGGFGYAIK